MKEELKQDRKQTRLLTKKKRKTQQCKVYELKFDKSHLSKEKQNHLNKLFIESKWFYNAILSSGNVFNFDEKTIKIPVLNKEGEQEEREIKFLTAQMRQAIKDRTIGSIKALSTKKKKGKHKEVGKLKFKSKVNSIPLKQFGATYKFESDKYIKIQGFKKRFKINGYNQIPEHVEFANANLIKRNKDFYLNVTCFIPKQKKIKMNKSIGLDFGIKDSVVTSNGDKYFFNFPETKGIKKAARRLSKKKKGSNNRYRAKATLKKKYEKLSNRKKDVRNKFVSKLISENDYVVIQDESIKAWHKSKMKGFGRRVQHSIMGGIISDLKKKSETLVVDKYFPSTKLCPSCGLLNKSSLDDRIYICGCGYSRDRDIHSANNILREGLKNKDLKKIDMGHINKMSAEKISDSDFKIPDFKIGLSLMKQEAQSL